MIKEPETITMNVSLPAPLKQFVDGKVSSGIYGSASEFVREAIREKLLREQDLKQAHETLAALLREGKGSGAIPLNEEYFEKKRKKLLLRIREKNDKS